VLLLDCRLNFNQTSPSIVDQLEYNQRMQDAKKRSGAMRGPKIFFFFNYVHSSYHIAIFRFVMIFRQKERESDEYSSRHDEMTTTTTTIHSQHTVNQTIIIQEVEETMIQKDRRQTRQFLANNTQFFLPFFFFLLKTYCCNFIVLLISINYSALPKKQP
jgi:hypothetical protein